MALAIGHREDGREKRAMTTEFIQSKIASELKRLCLVVSMLAIFVFHIASSETGLC